MQNKKIWINSLLAAILYAVAIALQYFLVEINGIKFIAVLGPSRFTMFGPWFLCVFFIYTLYETKTTKFLALNYLILLSLLKFTTTIRFIFIYGMIALFLCVFNMISSNKYEKFDDDMVSLFEFAIHKSKQGDIFSIPYGKPIAEFPLITNRGIFFGNGFPFSEKNMPEFAARQSMVFGNSASIRDIKGSWIGEKYSNFYRALAPINFINIASNFRLDWVVVESEYSDKFRNCESSLESKKYKIYSLDALRACRPSN